MNQNRLARPAFVFPFGVLFALVDAEFEMSIIRLSHRDAGMVLDGQVEPGPRRGIEFADQIADGVVEFHCRVDQQSHAEVARSELQIIGHFDAALATVKGSAFSSKRDGLRTPMTVVAGRIPGILRQRPMPDELRFGGKGRWNQQASPGSED